MRNPAQIATASSHSFPILRTHRTVAALRPVPVGTGGGSKAFSAAESIGMVHYMRLESGDSSGYRLTVFGRKGILDTRWGGNTQGR